MWHYHDGMGWWMVFVGITIAILFTGIMWALLRDARRVSKEGPDSETGHDRALSIANERYARGEISREEFERIKQAISS